MPKVTSAKTNFTSGEISSKVRGRFDIARYENAALTLKNMLIHQAGGAFFRPGKKYVAEVKDSAASTRIIPFQFSTTQNYMLELGNLYLRLYANEGRVLNTAVNISAASKTDPVVIAAAGHGLVDGDWFTINDVVGMTELNGKTFIADGVAGNNVNLQDIDAVDVDGTGFTTYVSGGETQEVIEVTTTYTTAQLFAIQAAQTADVQYLVHSSHKPRKLVRVSAISFTLTDVVFVRGPFLDPNITAVTLTPSADTGTITLTSSGTPFLAGHVGSLWRVKEGVVKITKPQGLEIGQTIIHTDGNIYEYRPDGTEDQQPWKPIK